jgi:peptidoglycan/xylan/chitin deacetylase (PgdA/CDA1 family)
MTSLAFSKFRIRLKSTLKVLLCPIGLVFRPRKNGPLVLMYHRVNAIAFHDLGPVSRELTVPEDAFREQLNFLKSSGYRSVSLQEFGDMIEGKTPLDVKSLLITFDDGYADNLQVAAPVLQASGFGATVFVMSEHLGKNNSDIWPLGDPGPNGDLMDANQLLDWARAGFEIGSHTRTHPVLVHLNDDQLREELHGSRMALEALLGSPINALAYPGGEYDPRVEEMAGQSGYRTCFTTKAGRSAIGDRLTSIRRVEVSASDTAMVFKIKIAGLLDWMGFRDSPAYRGFLRAIHRALVAVSAYSNSGKSP